MSEEELATILVGEVTEVEVPEQAVQDWPLDEVCAAAVDVARQALLAEAEESQVGDHLKAVAEGPLVVTHYFAGNVAGYTGWRWAVTVTRAPDTDQVTVDETALLPDSDALLAPAWVPWKQRILSGDLKAGDVMVTEVDDPRLVPGLTENDIPEEVSDLQPPQWEIGLGRVRILSPEGRREAAHRWYREVGPRSPIARAADLHCTTCGFLMLIAGPLGQAFGVCANGYSPVDGRIVAMTFGCGAHSETMEKPGVAVADVVVDEVGYDEMPSAQDGADVTEPAQDEPDAESMADEVLAQDEPDAEPEPAKEVAQDAGPPAASEREQDAGPRTDEVPQSDDAEDVAAQDEPQTELSADDAEPTEEGA